MQSFSPTGSKKNYDLLEEVGAGAYGTVYKAERKSDKKTVAVKVITADANLVSLLAELNMVIGLNHENIVKYYECFIEDGRIWIVMEFCTCSVSDILKTLKRPLTEREAAPVLRDVLHGLDYFHSLHRIHRDIKSGNLLVNDDGVVKLCDFGVSAQLDDIASKTGTRIGSPYFMAPEVINSMGHNTKADIWSLGITALEMVTGAPPLANMCAMAAMMHIPQNPPPVAPDTCSEDFKDFVKTALVKDPELRPTAAELLQHPFIKKAREGHQVIKELVEQYIEAKDDGDTDYDYYEEEEEDKSDYSYEEDVQESATPDMLSTILYGGETFVQTSTMVTTGEGGASGTSGLSQWTPEFVDTPQTKFVSAAQKRHFRNFKDKDLKFLLEAVKNLALQELKKPAADRNVVINNYEDCRRAMVAELQRRDSSIPDDFQKIDQQ